MPLPFLAVAAGIQAAGSIAKAVKGFGDLKDAKELAKNNIRPTYNIEDEYYNNQGIAENLAQGGLTQQSKDYYTSQADRGLSAGIDATLRGGGGINGIANIYDQYLQGSQRVAAEDSQQRTNNLKLLMDANTTLAGQETQAWALNKYEPYKDTAKAAADAKAAATANIFGGIQGLASGAAIMSSAQAGNKAAVADGVDVAGTVPTAASPNLTAVMAPYTSIVQASGAQPDNRFTDSIQDMLKKRYPSSPYIDNFMTSNRASA